LTCAARRPERYREDGIVTVVAFAGNLKRLGLGLPEYFVILKVDPPVPPM
jgi:hypothetical protein